MKGKIIFVFLILYALILFSGLASCNTGKKNRYRIYVQINNNTGENYTVTTSFRRKSNTLMPLKDGFVLVSELGEQSLSDADIGQVVKDARVQLFTASGKLVCDQSFSYPDGFAVKLSGNGERPLMQTRNEIALFLEVSRTEGGEVSLTVSKETDPDF